MKFNKVVYHIAFWLLAYLFWIFIFRNGTLVLTHAITIQFCYLVFISANYYLNTSYAIPHLLNKSGISHLVLFFDGDIDNSFAEGAGISLGYSSYI